MPDAPLLAPILSGVFAFSGVLLAQAVVVWTQKRKTFDEDVRRWQEERRTLYARFVSETEAVAHRITEAHNTNNPSKLPNIHDPKDYRIEAIVNEILLIASPEVVKAAQELDARTFINILGTWKWVIGDGGVKKIRDLESMDDETREELEVPQRLATLQFLRIARMELMEPSSVRRNSKFILYPEADIDRLSREDGKESTGWC